MVGWPFRRNRVSSFADSPPYDPAKNPYRARRPWPPDFSLMDEKHKFRLEKRYKRRTQTAFLRPGWVKGVKIAQWSICSFVVVYALLFMQNTDPNTEEPFGTFRKWLLGEYKAIWISQPPPKPHTGRIGEQQKAER